MWLMTTYGFFSIVRKGEQEFHVRARVKEDLKRLRAAAGLTEPVLTTRPADYRYRLVVGQDGIRRIMDILARSITYPNFKEQVSRQPDQKDKLPAYHRIWEIMDRLQS